MIIRLIKYKNRFIRYKVYFQRSTIYIGIFNSVMIFGIFIKTMGLPNWVIPFGLLIGLIFMFILGYLDHKYILEKENEILYDKTPQIKELLKMK